MSNTGRKGSIGSRRSIGNKKHGSFLCLLCFVCFLCFAPSGRSQTPALTTVRDTVYRSDGTPASGTVVITWPAFVTSDGRAVFGGTKTLPLTNGALAVALVPNSGGTPSGTSYQVKYFQSGGVFFEETWVVPTSSPLANPAQPVSVAQAGTPGSTTYYYWCTATNANGETLLSPSRITTTSNATLSMTNYNVITCATVSGATGYKAYRTTTSAAPSGTGNYLAGSSATTTLNDQSNTLQSATIPALNTTDPRTLSLVRVTAAPSSTVTLAASQVQGNAIVSNPSATQTITAPAGSGIPQRLALGGANTFLGSNGTDAAWTAPSGGGAVLGTGRTLTGGAGIAAIGDLSADRTIATASQETGFLADGGATSLTCGASTSGQVQVMDDGTLEWCDGQATAALRTSALGDGNGNALSGDTATGFFSTGTIEDARIDGNTESDEVTLAGDVDGTANANDLDEAAVEAELESVLDLPDLQGTLTVSKGGTGAAPGADDQVLVADSSSAATWRSVPNCNTENHLTYATASNTFGCEADDGGGGGGDNLRVEDGDNGGTFTAMSDADFDDAGDINFARTAGPPDVITATVRADSVALTTDTTGSYVQQVADGTGIDGTANAEGATYTPTLDLTEINDTTFGDNSDATLTHTVDPSGTTNPVWSYSDGVANLSTGTLQAGGNAVATTSNTITFTNKTLDSEATGNSVSIPAKHWIPAAGCDAATAGTSFDLPSSSAPAKACLGSGTRFGTLDYADGSTLTAYTHWHVPGDWTSTGGFDIKVVFTGSTSSSNNIRWQVSTACVADSEDLLSPSFNSASAANAAGPTTAGQRRSNTFTGVSVSNCAAGELMFLKVERVGGDAGDAYTGDGRLLGIEITGRRAM